MIYTYPALLKVAIIILKLRGTPEASGVSLVHLYGDVIR